MKIDHSYTDEIVCPNCGYKFGDSYEYFGSTAECADNIYCDECDNEFDAVRNISVTYTTYKKEITKWVKKDLKY